MSEEMAATGSAEVATVRDAFTRFIEAFNEGAFEEAFAEVQEITGVGPDRFLIELVGHGEGNVSGLETDRRFWNLLEVEDGRARRLHEFADRQQALAAAGVNEERG